MRVVALLITIVSMSGLTRTSLAETFLGEEQRPGETEERTNGKLSAERLDRPSAQSAASENSGTWGGSFGLGAGSGYFAASGSVHYGWNRYLGTSVSYDYERVDTGERFGEEHGPDVHFVLKLANPTVVTPVAGAGPGYIVWARRYNDEVFSEGRDFVMNYFAGINVALSKHFGISIHRRKMEYLGDRPLRYADRVTKEDRGRIDNNIGFYASF